MTHQGEGPDLDAAGERRRGRVRRLSVAVFVVIATATVAGSVGIGRVVHDQESRLLRQRAREVASLLSNATSQLFGTLGTLGTLVGQAGDAPQQLTPQLEEAVTAGPYRTVAVVDPASATVVAAAGEGVAAGVSLTGAPASAVRRVGEALTTTGVFRQDGAPRLGFAVRPPAARGLALYAEVPINPEIRTPATSGAPFSDLAVALYASSRPDPAQVILSNADDLPLQGDIVLENLDIGADRWVMAVSARSPLVGSVAESTPWLLLVGGLVLALAMAAIIEVLARQRAQVQSLVAERTKALQLSLLELEEAQTRLVSQERLAAIGELAAGVGHELRNPLAVMANAHFLVRSALESGNAGERSLRQLGIAEREVAQASLIVADLLDFARPRDPILTAVSLADLVAEVMSVSPAPTGIQVVVKVPDDLSAVEADRDQLRQVVQNLVTNAFEAMDGGGVVTIGARALGNTVELTVTDDGSGMDPGIRSRVFEPFFTAKARGIGLGLSVTKRIVEAHSGSIAVSSEPGQGTTFTVVLPQAATAEAGSR